MDYNVIKELPADLGMTVYLSTNGRTTKYMHREPNRGIAPPTTPCRGCQGSAYTMTSRYLHGYTYMAATLPGLLGPGLGHR